MNQEYKPPLSRKDKEKRRLKAAKMFEKGLVQTKIARKLKVTPAAVNQWHKAWKKKGEEALRSKGHPGFSSELTEDNRKKLKKILLRGPVRYGYPTELWTLSRIAEVIRKEFKITFTEAWVWHILHDLGFTVQKPQVKAKERNEKAISAWKETELPRLKKMGPKTRFSPGFRG